MARQNERKVSKRGATLLRIVNYPHRRPELVTSTQRVQELEGISRENRQVQKKDIHIIFSFHQSDELYDMQLLEIAEIYMNKLGYEDQPQLLYRHDNEPHTSLNIVTTRVEVGGRVVRDSFSFYKSESARKSIEVKYNLIRG